LHISLPRLHTIDEFRRATWRSDAGFFVWLALVAGVGATATRRLPPGARSALLPALAPAATMAALGIWSVRFSADAAFIAAPILATRLTSLLARRPVRRAPASAVVVAALLLAALAPRLADARAGRPVLSIDVDPDIVPRDAIQFVTAHGLRERMYNDFETGSYLAFEGYPRYRVFVDPRLPAYPPELHRLLGDFDMDRTRWDAAMQRYGVTSALLAYAGVNRRVAWWDPERWALVYRAHDARVFVRRLPAWRALIAAYEIPATFRFTVEEGAETVPLLARPGGSPVTDCEWQRRLGDLMLEMDGGKLARALPAYERALEQAGCLAPRDEAGLAGWLGAAALQAKQFERSVALTGRALALEPADTSWRSNRAVAYEALGRREAAAEDWARVAAAVPGSPLGQAAAERVRRLRAAVDARP
jgi:tetratricopeptide (TPR) repeat protein